MSGLFGFGLLQEHESVWLRHFGNQEWATDCDRRLIKRSDYGKETPYAWEKDHIVPKALGGSDDLSNLRPRHRKGNARAGGILGNALRSPPPRGGLINGLANALTSKTPKGGLF